MSSPRFFGAALLVCLLFGFRALALDRKEEFKKALSGTVAEAKLTAVFGDERLVLDRTVLPKKGKKGDGYFSARFGLLTDESLERGREYAKSHHNSLSSAAKLYGVPSEIILAIIRIETNFGKFLGTRPLPVTLYSLYALSPARRPFALREMRYFLSDIAGDGGDPFAIVGSVAGAFGICQFLPSSYKRYAISSGGAAPDLWFHDDAVLSVAHYLKKNGWGKSIDSRLSAVFAYNHSKEYALAVFAYAKAVKKKNE